MKNLLLITSTVLFITLSSHAFAAGSPGTETTTQGFLEALEQGGGTPLEQLSVKDARMVLVKGQHYRKLTYLRKLSK